MPFQPDGSFTRVIDGGWQADRDAGTKITAVRHDAEDDNFATGLGDTITRHGTSIITANTPWNNKKITDLGGPPTEPGDATNKAYVDTFKDFTTGLNISGAGPINGFIQFSSPTGVNGIGWTTADMSWIGRIFELDKTSRRLAVNDAPDGTGNDVFIIDETGRANSIGVFSNNLSYDNQTPTASWRTIVAGLGTLISTAGGALAAMSNDVVTTVAYQIATVREFFKVANAGGTVTLDLTKSASGKAVVIRSYMTDKLRWAEYLGSATAESGVERVGSDYILQSFNNAGGGAVNELVISRATHAATFGGDVSGQDVVTLSGTVRSTTPILILAAPPGGNIRLRPDGPTSALTSCMITGTGDINVCEGDATPSGGIYAGLGMRGKAGQVGAYAATWNNFYWDGTYLKAYVGSTFLGNIAWQCDYRIKKNVKALPSTWEQVKALRPVSFQQKKFDIFEENDTVRLGFIAHELQERLGEGAATGKKDEENTIQSPDPMAIIAALTRALQEAMLRIEALEASA